MVEDEDEAVVEELVMSQVLRMTNRRKLLDNGKMPTKDLERIIIEEIRGRER